MTQRKKHYLDNVLEEVRKVYTSDDKDLSTRLYREIIINALKFRKADLDILDLKVISRAMAEFRYAARVFKPYRNIRKVSIFGSARTAKDNPYYELATQFARFC